MKPYYQDSLVEIYHGDARDILPIFPVGVCITDPVWPNAHPDLVGADRPLQLFREVIAEMHDLYRLCVWLGCQSDPRFLSAVPEEMTFLRICYLSRAVPSYNGRCLVSGDVLYCFGEWPKPRKGAIVLPGEHRVTSKPGLREDHPCARNEEHARWVVKFWAGPGEVVFDPFAGTGTILRAAKDHGRAAVGIEIEEKYCEIAAKRMSQGVLDFQATPTTETPE